MMFISSDLENNHNRNSNYDFCVLAILNMRLHIHIIMAVYECQFLLQGDLVSDDGVT